MIHLTKHKAFLIDGVQFVPYRHHMNSLTWLVQVIDEDRAFNFSCVAGAGEEAALRANKSYQRYLIEEKNLHEFQLKEAQEEARREAIRASRLNAEKEKRL